MNLPFTQRSVATAIAFLWIAGVALSLKPLVLPAERDESRLAVIAAYRARSDDGLSLAASHLARYPDDFEIVAIAAEIAYRNSRTDQAIHYYQLLPRDAARWEFTANLGLGRQYQFLVDLSAAEKHYRRALEISPFDLAANEHLGHLLQSEGRVWEGSPFFMTQILRGKCRGDELLAAACAERFFRVDERLNHMTSGQQPTESPMLIAVARNRIFDNQHDAAEELLRQLVQRHPEQGEAQGRLGRILVDRGDDTRFKNWLDNLPDVAAAHPEVWFSQGLQAQRLKMTSAAAYCFHQTIQRSPGHIAATLQLAQCLEQSGRQDEARLLAQRGKLLAELDSQLNMLRQSPDRSIIRKTIQILAQLERYWEAAGWCHVMVRISRQPEDGLRQDMKRYVKLARQTTADRPLTEILKRADFKPPRWPSQYKDQSHASNHAALVGPSQAWEFSDDAGKAGITFSYYEGTTEDTRLQHIFNTMGGGCGVLDYDQDGWPDLHLAQACDWRQSPADDRHTDRCYRNLGCQQFDDVTRFTRTEDTGFTHGIAIQDFDADGFPDIYVGNMGPNRLYHNNGDGTFRDITATAGVAGNEWTTSSVWADLTGDHLPDLYVLNYSHLEETRNKECLRSLVPVACTPDVLTPEFDRLYINAGNGTFRDASEADNFTLPAGRGLGVIAWDFLKTGRLSLFIANDTMANFLLVNTVADSDQIPQLRDEAVVRGIGLDTDGNAQASMGVAAGDANGDGRIDLFITTFFGESNTMYSLQDDGFFEDSTRHLNLRDPGFWMLGFGSQFADFNNDGWQDLVVGNGHVDQKSSRGDPDRMPSQLFANNRGVSFTEVPGDRLGAYFQSRYLSRGLAVLDWNRDGRMDFVVSHLHAPLSLVTNLTPPQSRPMSIRLIGQTDRTPTGATVTLRSNGWQQTRFALSGDGFLVSNDRRLHFAVPPGTDTVDITVEWLSHRTETWPSVRVSQECDVVENGNAFTGSFGAGY